MDSKAENLGVRGIRYNRKLIVSGDVFELIEYEREIVLGELQSVSGGRSGRASPEDKVLYRQQTLRRAKANVRRLINANVGVWGYPPVFLTLTFAENVQDIRGANYEFKKFRQRLEYRLKIKLEYVGVIEFQKRGAIHYHVVIFNLPYIEAGELAEIWGHGFIKINKIDQVDNIGAYVSKYMTKDEYEKEKTDRLIGEKSYFTSRGLRKPLEIVDEKEIERLAAALSGHKVYSSEYYSDLVGKITYVQYNRKRSV